MEFLKKLFSPKTKSLYQQIGEESGIKAIVSNFYLKMETDPKAEKCLRIHKLEDNKVPEETKEKLFMFLSGWLGGPNLFVENHGHPRMRMRHMHVKISTIEADEWLYCMEHAIKVHPKKLSKKFKTQFMNSCKGLSLRIINS